jgi:hypothetical protein
MTSRTQKTETEGQTQPVSETAEQGTPVDEKTDAPAPDVDKADEPADEPDQAADADDATEKPEWNVVTHGPLGEDDDRRGQYRVVGE